MGTEIILIIDGEMEMTIDGKNYKGSSGDLFIAEKHTRFSMHPKNLQLFCI
jgi:quercetin dioxygenase-like cupin family protein